MITICLFDIDGTLILSGRAGSRALDMAFLDLYGWEGAMADVSPGGKTDPAIVDEVFRRRRGRPSEGVETEHVLDRYLEHLEETVAASAGYHVLPGVPELLEALETREDVLLGLATGNLQRGAAVKLRRGGLDRFFRFGGYGSDSSDRLVLTRLAVERGMEQARLRRPDGGEDETRVWVIGDSPADVACGRGAGARTLAVETGPFARDELVVSNPDAVLEDLSRTGAVLERLLAARPGEGVTSGTRG
jgi:phosphoglycolate phosphatase